MRRLVASITIALLGALTPAALARTVEIVSADRLELRKVDGQELVIISGGRVELRIDRDTVSATRVEYNKTRRTLTLVGTGRYTSFPRGPDGQETEQVLQGQDIVVNLGTENLAGEDVIVSTRDLEIRGEDVERVPGQLKVDSGYFTLCAKCGRTPNDYAFRASRVLLYPGDRLVAYDATLLLLDAPVAYLPVVVLLLQDKQSQPRFQIEQDSVDGLRVLLDLPFVIGTQASGFTLLRYYQNRESNIGFGVNMRAYDLPLGVRLAELYALATPRPVGKSGYDVDFRVSARGFLPWDATLAGVDYTLTANRSDSTVSADTDKGVSNVDLEANAKFDILGAQLNYEDRFGPEPDGFLLNRQLKRPELVLDFNPYTAGDLTADFKVTLGNYRGPARPSVARGGELNISRFRLQESHVITYLTRPWNGAEFNVRNTFTGNYYNSGERVVDLFARAALTQNFTADTSATLDYEYLRQEGVAPFSLDTSFRRRLSATLGLGVRSRLAPWLSVEGAQRYDFVQPTDNQAPARFSVTLTPDPLNATGTLNYNLFENELDNWSVQATLGRTTVGPSLSASTSFDEQTGYTPLITTFTFADPTSAATASLSANYNLQQGYLDTLTATLNATASRDAIVNPVTVNARTEFSVRNPRLNSTSTITWRDLSFNAAATFLLPDGAVEPGEDYTAPCTSGTAASRENCGTLTFGISSPSGAATFYSATYGGTYDLGRGGWVSPTLTGRVRVTRPGQTLDTQASFATPGLDNSVFELTSAALTANLDVTPRVGLSGTATYARSRSGGNLLEQLTLRPLNATFALGGGPRPDAYVTLGLNQSFSWLNGKPQQPQSLKPILLVTLDRCCWALQFELNPVDQRVRFTVSLPTGSGQSLIVDPNGPRLPGLPFGGTNP
ncbi:hypothetical protein [Deinococcus pimensis]|uniref:hypothetical protein n=1 Tax=Deinococcus pimensis TaxID=309888 RepID=UPI0005EB11D8|nr:hypothetical protein [Deinococcus pimensis]